MVAPIGLWPKPDQLHDIPRAILASVKAQIAALLPGEMEVVRVPAEDMRWLLWESKQLRTIGGDPRDDEIARLKAEVGSKNATIEATRRHVDRLRRALAAGPAALRAKYAGYKGGIVKGAYDQSADLVERAQAEAMKEDGDGK